MPSGPVQPMSNIAQAGLRGMRDEVLAWNPDYPPFLADTSINNKLREVLDRRMWSGLLVKDQLVVPEATNRGTVAVVRASATVTGTDTAWPVADEVNTALTETVLAADINIGVDAPLGSTANITIGDWLVIAAGTVSEEIVLVTGVSPRTIRTIFTKAHGTAAGVTKSSLSRLQFRANSSPYYTIKGVTSPTQLVLDLGFGGLSATLQSYSIFMTYVTFGPGVKMVYSLISHSGGAGGYRLKLHIPQEAINFDRQRNSVGQPYLLLDYVPDEVGRPRFELYPRPTSAQVMPYIVYRQVPNLTEDDDTPPPFIRSDVLVKGALADALRWRGKANKYYDPQTAMQKLVEFEKGLIEMAMADDSVYLTNLLWDSNMPYGHGGEWYQSHDADF